MALSDPLSKDFLYLARTLYLQRTVQTFLLIVTTDILDFSDNLPAIGVATGLVISGETFVKLRELND